MACLGWISNADTAASDADNPLQPGSNTMRKLEQEPRWVRRWRTVGGVGRAWVLLGALLRWIT